MSNALRDMFRRLPRGNERTVSDLEEQLASLDRDLAKAEAAANVAYLDKPDEAQGHETHLRNLRQQRDRVSGALSVARERVDRNAEIASAEETEAAWRKTEKLAKQRESLAVEMEVAALRLVDAMKEMAQINGEMFQTAPDRKGKLHNSGMSLANSEMALRLFLRKHGLNWAADYPWGSDAIPTISDTVKASNAEILANHPKVKK